MCIDLISEKKSIVVLSYGDVFSFSYNNGCGHIANYKRDHDMIIEVEEIGSSYYIKSDNNNTFINMWVDHWEVKYGLDN